MSYQSTRKEPLSMKLRVANMKTEDVQGRTKQLEDESRKMEDRLRELKLAMNHEKEVREQRGGGHWKSGKEGNLNSHAKDVLNKPPSKPKPTGSGKTRKVKVLKDEPIKPSKPKERPKPGSLAFLAQRDTTKPGLRPDGPICGQCEIKSAAVTCQECSELYCSGCFTAFHLKGALAKHHSVPVSKIAFTPRGSNTSSNHSLSSTQSNQSSTTSSKRPSTAEMKIRWEQHEPMAPPPPPVQTVIEYAEESKGGSLLDGDYDEREAANSFQQALSEWRKENTEPEPVPAPAAVSSSRSLKPTQLSARGSLGTKKPRVKLVSPVTTPRVNIDEGTSTTSGSLKPSTDYTPQFTNSSELSYAERLMLKKNRRSDVPSTLTGAGDGRLNGFYQDDGDDAMLAEEGVVVPSFDSLLATAQQGARGAQIQDYQDSTAGTVVEIEELFIDEFDGSEDNESQYVVEPEVEEPSDQTAGTLTTVLPAPTAMFQKSRKPKITQNMQQQHALFTENLSGRLSQLSSSLQIVDVSDSVEVTPVDSPAKVPTPNQRAKPLKSARKHQIDSSSRPGSANSVSSTRRPPKSARGVKNSPPTNKANNAESVTSRPPSRGGRPVSAAGNRPPTRNNTSFHNAARPRTAAEKATDMFGEGVLTKQPSSALKDIISKYKSEGSAYSSGSGSVYETYSDNLGEFLTLGVKKQFVEKTLTPRKEKPSQPGAPLKKHQISNKVYTLSTKSWRPDSSLGDNVEEAELQKFYQEVDPKLFYDPAADIHPESDPVFAPEQQETTIRYTWSAGASRTAATNLQSDSVTDSITQSLSERLKLPEPSDSTPRRHTPSSSRPTSTRYSISKSQNLQDLRGSVSRSKTEGVIGSGKNRHHDNKRRCKTPMSARSYTPIVVDGDDMTRYDDMKITGGTISNFDSVGNSMEEDKEDEEAMNDLEMELASQTGRLTADGRLSRLVFEDQPIIDVNDNMKLTTRSGSITPDTHRDIDKLRESMMDDFEESELLIMQDEAMRVSLL